MTEKPCNYTFDDLKFHYATGRSFTISGSGRNAKKGYRFGIMCNLGNLEEHKWCALMDELIDRSGERKLHNQLLEWLEDNPLHMARKELDIEVLRLHSMRMFDCERWRDFIPFNQRYRPDVLQKAKTRWIKTTCCRQPGRVTQAQLDEKHHQNSDGQRTVSCPICGRWSTYQLLD